jgi:hypothetical protein
MRGGGDKLRNKPSLETRICDLNRTHQVVGSLTLECATKLFGLLVPLSKIYQRGVKDSIHSVNGYQGSTLRARDGTLYWILCTGTRDTMYHVIGWLGRGS